MLSIQAVAYKIREAEYQDLHFRINIACLLHPNLNGSNHYLSNTVLTRMMLPRYRSSRCSFECFDDIKKA